MNNLVTEKYLALSCYHLIQGFKHCLSSECNWGCESYVRRTPCYMCICAILSVYFKIDHKFIAIYCLVAYMLQRITSGQKTEQSNGTCFPLLNGIIHTYIIMNIVGNDKLPLVDLVQCPRWGAGPRIPPQDMVEIVRFDRNVDRSRRVNTWFSVTQCCKKSTRYEYTPGRAHYCSISTKLNGCVGEKIICGIWMTTWLTALSAAALLTRMQRHIKNKREKLHGLQSESSR